MQAVSHSISSLFCERGTISSSTALKVSLLIIGLGFGSASVGMHLSQINAIATYVSGGVGGLVLLSAVGLQVLDILKNTPTDVKPQLSIKDKRNQEVAFNHLPAWNQETDEQTTQIQSCDQYCLTGVPSDEARVYLNDDTPTNGAFIWDKLILIQGPHRNTQESVQVQNRSEIRANHRELMWSKKLVRLFVWDRSLIREAIWLTFLRIPIPLGM